MTDEKRTKALTRTVTLLRVACDERSPEGERVAAGGRAAAIIERYGLTEHELEAEKRAQAAEAGPRRARPSQAPPAGPYGFQRPESDAVRRMRAEQTMGDFMRESRKRADDLLAAMRRQTEEAMRATAAAREAAVKKACEDIPLFGFPGGRPITLETIEELGVFGDVVVNQDEDGTLHIFFREV